MCGRFRRNPTGILLGTLGLFAEAALRAHSAQTPTHSWLRVEKGYHLVHTYILHSTVLLQYTDLSCFWTFHLRNLQSQMTQNFISVLAAHALTFGHFLIRKERDYWFISCFGSKHMMVPTAIRLACCPCLATVTKIKRCRLLNCLKGTDWSGLAVVNKLPSW